MSSEADQPQPAVESQELVSREPERQEPVTAAAASRPSAPAPVRSAKPRAGVPVWRTGKPDAFLAAAVDTARTAIEGITAAKDIGRHLAAKSEGDRLVTHLFESRLPGYGGWQWFAVLTRNSRSKMITVNELGLLPSEDSILAPEWVPWAERVRPEDEQEPGMGEVQPDSQEQASAEPAAADDAAAEPGAGEQEQGPEPLQDQDFLQDQDQESGDGEPDDDGGQPGDDARTS